MKFALILMLLGGPVWADDKAPLPGGHAEANDELEQVEAPDLKFPCLPTDKPLPKIYLLGETHHTRGEDDIKFESMLGASRGKCYVASEGFLCNETDPYAKVFKLTPKEAPGIEDPFAQGIAALLRGFATNDIRNPDTNDFKRYLMEEFNRNRFMGIAWRAGLRKQYGNKETDPSVDKITKIVSKLSTSSPSEVRETLKSLPENHPWFTDTGAWSVVFKRWVRGYADMMMSEPYKSNRYVPTNARDLIENALTGADPLSVIKQLVVKWRDQFMAKAIAKFYCDTVLKGGKPLRVIVGPHHFPGLEKLIAKMSDGKIKVERKVDENEPWVKDLRKELKDLRDKEAPPERGPREVQIADQPLKIHEDKEAPHDYSIRLVKNGVRYVLHLEDYFDPLFHKEAAWRKGDITITAPESEKDGRLKFFLGELEALAKTDKKVAKIVEDLGLAKSSEIKGNALSGKAESGYVRIRPNPK